ncbi:hypothetical protein [Actinacidiphila soli]|uniref:hypothetical protein n=1 Tax=Actinacidiphila soli TaxID=2487275 RepID=UPI000FCB932A|nr:hypothetical protein [Actinacidiphila soli]
MEYNFWGGTWVQDADLTSCRSAVGSGDGAGRLAVPRPVLASGGTTGGTVAPLLVSLEHQNPATLAWTDDDDVALRYRLTDSATGALYGNVR